MNEWINDLSHQFASCWLHSNLSLGWVKLMSGSATWEREPLPSTGILILYNAIIGQSRDVPEGAGTQTPKKTRRKASVMPSLLRRRN